MYKKIYKALSSGLRRCRKILISIVLGFLCGILMHYYPNHFINNILIFVGQAFIKALQMIIIPLVISAIVIGINKIANNRKLYKLSLKMLLYYGIITVSAVMIGLFTSIIIKPGVGLFSYVTSINDVSNVHVNLVGFVETEKNLLNIIINFFPKNPLESFANGEMFPIVVFTLLFAIALTQIGKKNAYSVVSIFDNIYSCSMLITRWVMRLSIYGIFALTAISVSTLGVTKIAYVSKYLVTLLVAFFIQLFVIYPIILKCFSKISVSLLYAKITEVLTVAFGVASSSAVLPLSMSCCRKIGISNKITSYVLPLGATLSMDGTAIFQVIAVMFILQVYNIPLTFIMLIQIILFTIIASCTNAGLPGTGLISTALILFGIGLNPEQLAVGFVLLYSIDRLVNMFRTILNVGSDIVVAATIADNEGELDYKLLEAE